MRRRDGIECFLAVRHGGVCPHRPLRLSQSAFPRRARAPIVCLFTSYGVRDSEYEYESADEYGSDGEDASIPDGSAALAASVAPASPLLEAARTGSRDCRMVPAEEIETEMRRNVREIASVLAVPEDVAEALCVDHKWNSDRILERCTEDPIRSQEQSGVSLVHKEGEPPGAFLCEVCFTDYARPSDGYQLGCEHAFCKECWSQMLSTVVGERGAEALRSQCLAQDCDSRVTRRTVRAVADPTTQRKWDRFLAQDFVSASRAMAWCPGPGCGNAFVASGPVDQVTCTCGMKFCFKCGREGHQPATCPMVEAWLKKCGDESETANWMLANTKQCPKCEVRIEKNQGCQHIRCFKCGHEFCWTCLGPWADHGQASGGYYACNRYDARRAALERGSSTDSASRAKLELDRYLFYFQRYSNHHMAGLFAKRMRSRARERMEVLQAESSGMDATNSWADVQFLENSTEVLLDCRRVLKYTYVMAFYMDDGPEKTLFEHLQEHLERATEQLAELTEQSPANMDRAEILNYTRVTNRFLEQLLDGVREGLTGDVASYAVGRVAEGGGSSSETRNKSQEPPKRARQAGVPSMRGKEDGRTGRGLMRASRDARRRGRR